MSTGPGDDVTIADWNTSQNITNDNIAWIEAHSSANNIAPRMPQLEFQISSLPADVILEAKLEVQYDRGNGSKIGRNRTEDNVKIPANGSWQSVVGNKWRIWETYSSWPFFGGEAILSYRLMKNQIQIMAPQIMRFRIGGKNPQPIKARQFIETLSNAGPQGSLWFAYAIAKSESKDYNGASTRYNQFLQLPSGPNDTYKKQLRQKDAGRPVYHSDGANIPGGYGLFQVTGSATDPTFDILPREIWNWQENCRAALLIIEFKKSVADAWMIKQKNTSNANGVALPSLTVHNVTFAEGTNRTINNAVTMKAYNGGSPAPNGFIDNDGPAPGFIIDPQSGGHFCYWKNSASGSNKWALSRYNNPNGEPPFNYISRVCLEVE